MVNDGKSVEAGDTSVQRNGTNVGRVLADEGPRSVLYEFDRSRHALLPVDSLPWRIQIRQVAVGSFHQAIVTNEKLVYVWGENGFGQLGVGDRRYRHRPCLVDSLNGKLITQLAVGNATNNRKKTFNHCRHLL